MYLNLALLFLAYYKGLNDKKKRKYMLILIITILSAGSVMGIIVLILVMTAVYFHNKNMFSKLKISRIAKLFSVVVAIAIIFFFEFNTNFLYHYITNWNSFASRHDDTLLALFIMKDHPLMGVGVANDVNGIWISYFPKIREYTLYGFYGLKDLAKSNGLGDCLFTAGIPFTIFYMYKIVKEYKKMLFMSKRLECILLFFSIFLMFMNEPYMLSPFFLLTLFELNEKPNPPAMLGRME